MTPSNPFSQRATRALLLIGCTLSIFYSLGLITDQPHWLRGVTWVWRRNVPTYLPTRAWLLVLLLLIWLLLLKWVLTHQNTWARKQTALLILAAMLLSTSFPIAIAAQQRSQPLSIPFLTTASTTAGFFYEGVAIESPLTFLTNHATNMPGYRGVHLQTQPPGWPLAFWLTKTIWQQFPALADWVAHRLLRSYCTSPDLAQLTPPQIAAALLQMSILLISAIGIIPLYLLARHDFSPAVGRLAVALYPLLPGFLIFQARFDVAYAVIALFALWLGYCAYYRRRWYYFFSLSLLLGTVTWFSFGSLTFVLLLNSYLLAHALLRRHAWHGIQRITQINLAIALGFVVLWGIPWILGEVSLPQMFLIGRDIHHKVRISQPLWFLFNFYEVGVFVGFALFLPIIISLVQACFRCQKPQPQDPFVLGWAIFLLLLNLSGEVRAETGRLWLFLLPPGLLIASHLLHTLLLQPSPNRLPKLLLPFVITTFVLHAVTAALYLGNRVSSGDTPEAQWTLPQIATPVHYQLGPAIALRGYALHPSETDLQITLYWQALSRIREDYSVFVHLRQQGNVVAQADSAPVDGALPTWCWVPGEVVADSRRLSKPTLSEAAYEVGVGLYDWRTGQRLPVAPPVADEMIVLPASH